jgi:hypothetical protein
MKIAAAALLAFVATPALAIWPFDDATDEVQEAYNEAGCCRLQAGCEDASGYMCKTEYENACERLQKVAELRYAECRKDLDIERCMAAVTAGRTQAELECK